MILCAGEALIDMLPRTSTAGEDAFAPVPGGAVFNTAIALGRLGIPVRFFCGISRDLFGTRLMAALEASGVDAAPAIRSDRPTTLAFVELVDGQARYAFYDEASAARQIRQRDLPGARKMEGVDAVFVGGISLVPEPCGGAYEALAKRESGKRLVMLDPNIRQSFIKEDRPFRDRVFRMIASADAVKVSDEDLEWILGPGDIATRAEQMLALGPDLVCVTQGSKGVTAYLPGQEHLVLADRVEVVDTVGAGDTFNAGLLAGLHKAGRLSPGALKRIPTDDLLSALRLGARAAAVTVSRAGANPPWADELA
ncbi:carbohydrate kinase [Tropicimonas sp. IMCC34011]|uniref:carbohydrate kinase family protein n=1 Tax=Tropicimonas sp. IMCC34011 TaxID=2248759 RepID=UPI000E24E8CB|nr:carbohydrate kinase [Tropicimonas sp. IMCC34011]